MSLFPVGGHNQAEEVTVVSLDKNGKQQLHFADLVEAANKIGLKGYSILSAEMNKRTSSTGPAVLTLKYIIPYGETNTDKITSLETELGLFRSQSWKQIEQLNQLNLEIDNLQRQIKEAWRHVPDRLIVDVEQVPSCFFNHSEEREA